MIKLFQCHLSLFSDIKSLQGLLKVMAECDDKDIFLCHLSPFTDIKSLQGLLKVRANVMIKTLFCHLSPFSDIKSLQGLLNVRAECDDKDISVPSISL